MNEQSNMELNDEKVSAALSDLERALNGAVAASAVLNGYAKYRGLMEAFVASAVRLKDTLVEDRRKVCSEAELRLQEVRVLIAKVPGADKTRSLIEDAIDALPE
jgi:hypothetical protein